MAAGESGTTPTEAYHFPSPPEFSPATKRIWDNALAQAQQDGLPFSSMYVLEELWHDPEINERLTHAFAHFDSRRIQPPSPFATSPVTPERFEALIAQTKITFALLYPKPTFQQPAIEQALRRAMRPRLWEEVEELKGLRDNLIHSARLRRKAFVDPVDVLRFILRERVSAYEGSIAAAVVQEFLGPRRDHLEESLWK